jgi:cytochrome c-type biogenesis protein CcmH/NrfG
MTWEDGEWAEAAEVLIRRLRVERERGVLKDVLFRLGVIYAEKLPDVKRAVAAFSRVLQVDPENREALRYLADLHLRDGNWKEAHTTTARLAALETEPDKRVGHMLRLARIVDEGFRDQRRATDLYRKAQEVDPYSLAAIQEFARFYERQNDTRSAHVHLDTAITRFRGLLQQDPFDVHAYAALGSRISSSSAAATRPAVRSAGGRGRRRLRSHAQATTLAADRLAKVAQLVLNEAVDAVARLADRLPHFPLDAVGRNLIDEVTAVLPRPLRTSGARRDGATSGPFRAAQHGRDWSASRWPAPQEQGGGGADRCADERRGEQVVLGITPNLAVAGGLADAWPPLRAGRDRCTHRRSPPASDRARRASRLPRPRCEARRLRCALRAPSTPSR